MLITKDEAIRLALQDLSERPNRSWYYLHGQYHVNNGINPYWQLRFFVLDEDGKRLEIDPADVVVQVNAETGSIFYVPGL